MYYVGKKVTIQNAGTTPQINVENFDISVPVISSEGKKLFSYAQPTLKSINHADYGSDEINLELFENMSEASCITIKNKLEQERTLSF